MYQQQQYYYPTNQNYMRAPTPASYVQPQVQSQQPFMLKGRPVTSLEEVKASVIDFDGSVFYFPDIANRRIYSKQIGLDGSAILCMYEMAPLPQAQPVAAEASMNNFITREEFEQAIMELRAGLGSPVQTQVPNPVPADSARSVEFNF